MPRTLIIGAGLTGLSAAYHLIQSGDTDWLVAEKENTAGGLLRSARVHGFTFDHTGHFLHLNDDYFRQFLATVADMDDLDRIARKSAIFSDGVTTPYPYQMNLYGRSKEVIEACINGYRSRPQGSAAPHTFLQWATKHFGAGITTHFFAPFQRKILSYDLRKIEPSWTGRFVPKTNLEAMIAGSLQPPKPFKVGYNSQLYYPKIGGIDYLINRLQGQLPAQIQTGYDVARINVRDKVVTFTNGATEVYENLITTMPLNLLLSRLTHCSRSSLPQQARHLKCNSVLNINLGIAREDLGDNHWLYVPDTSYSCYRVGFWHNVCKNMVPAQHSALYAECSYLPERTSAAAVQRLRARCFADVKKLLKLGNEEIVVEHDLHLQHAYVLYDHWRKKNIKKILRSLEAYGIHSTGRFGGWKYSSMQEAVLDGREASERLTPLQSFVNSGAIHV